MIEGLPADNALRLSHTPIIRALSEWQTCAVINRYLRTHLLPPDLLHWSDDDRALVIALAERATGNQQPNGSRKQPDADE